MDKENRAFLDEYLENVSECYRMVGEWLKEESLSCKQIDHEIHEEASGRYTTQKLLIYKNESNRIAEMVPVGAWVIGADGRIDLIGNFDQQILIYLKEAKKIRTSVTISMNGDEHPDASKNSLSLYKGFEKAGWYWIEYTRFGKVRALNKDLFFELLSEVSDNAF